MTRWIETALCWYMRALVWGGVALLFWPAVQMLWDWWREDE